MKKFVWTWMLFFALGAVGSSLSPPVDEGDVAVPPQEKVAEKAEAKTPDLSRVAPDECWVWFQWNGMPQSDAASQNLTERLFTDEEVSAFLKRLRGTAAKLVADTTDEPTRDALKLLRIATSRPSVAFITSFSEAKPRPVIRAPEPDEATPAAASFGAVRTIGPDGLERIGVGFVAPPAAPATVYQLTTGPNGEIIAVPQPSAGPKAFAPVVAAQPTPPAGAAPICDAPVTDGSHAPVAKVAPGASLPRPSPPAPSGFIQSPGAEPIAPPAGVCTTCTAAACCESGACAMTGIAWSARGAWVLSLGDDAAEFSRILDGLMTKTGSELVKKQIGGVEFLCDDSTDGQQYRLGYFRDCMIFAFDEDSAKQAVAGLSGNRQSPAWLADLEKKLTTERPIARLHLNIDQMKRNWNEGMEFDALQAVQALGLDKISAVSFVAGLDDRGTAIKTLLATRDAKDAPLVFDFLGANGLTLADLKSIPKDATMAAAGKFDLTKISKLVEQYFAAQARQESPNDGSEQVLGQVIGDVREFLVESLGDNWNVYFSPSEGGIMASTFTVAVRNEARLKGAIGMLAILAKIEGASIQTFKYRGHDVTYWQPGKNDDSGICCAWTIVDGRLLVSMLPQTLKTHLARAKTAESLADVPDVKRLFTDAAGGANDAAANPLVLTYTDTREILRFTYQYGSLALPSIAKAISDSGADFAFHEIPSMAVIEQYFAPSVTTIRRTPSGLLVDSRQTLPFFSLYTALAATQMAEGFADIGDVADSFDIPSLPIADGIGATLSNWQGPGPFQAVPSGEWHFVPSNPAPGTQPSSQVQAYPAPLPASPSGVAPAGAYLPAPIPPGAPAAVTSIPVPYYSPSTVIPSSGYATAPTYAPSPATAYPATAKPSLPPSSSVPVTKPAPATNGGKSTPPAKESPTVAPTSASPKQPSKVTESVGRRGRRSRG